MNRQQEVEEQERALDALMDQQEAGGEQQEGQIAFTPGNPTQGEARQEAVEHDPWEQKYKTAIGIHQADNRRNREEIEQLKAKLEELSRGPKLDPAKGIKDGFGYLVEGDPDQGADMVVPAIDALVSTRVEEVINRHIQPIREQSRVMAQESFESALASRLPNWREIDNSPEFAQFLDTVEPMSGTTYRELGARAFPSMNLESTVAIYNQFLHSRQPATRQREIPAHLIVPGRSSAPVPAKPATTGRVTADQLAYAEKQLRTGRITEEEFDKVFEAYRTQGGAGNSPPRNSAVRWNDPLD